MFESVTSLLIQHDLVTVFVVVLLATLGISIPALPVLLLVGAQAAGDGRFGFEALGLATLASTLSAATWYAAGRRLGRRVMAFLCRISISPDTRKNETSFAKRGALTLVIAKFVPGLSILASPLAGALGMRVPRFLLFSTLGSALFCWTTSLSRRKPFSRWDAVRLRYSGGCKASSKALLQRWLDTRGSG